LYLIVNINVFPLKFLSYHFSDFDNILNMNLFYKLKIFESYLETL